MGRPLPSAVARPATQSCRYVYGKLSMMLQPHPLSGHNLFASRDLEETCHYVSDLLWPHRMRLLNGQNSVDTRLDGIQLDCVELFCLQYGAEVQLEPGEIDDFYLVQTTLAGNGLVVNGTRQAATRAGITTIVSPTEPTTTRMDADCQRLILRIRRDLVESRISRLLQKEVKSPLIFDLELSRRNGTDAAWLRTLDCICQQYSLHDQCLSVGSIRRQFAELLITQLLNTQPHNYSEQLQGGTLTALPAHVRRARDYIDAHLGDSLSMAELADAVGVSARTLQNGFQRFMEQTPTEYIREQRLQRAHTELQQADPTQSGVTDILFSLGISNPGRFAQIYRQRYGCLPSATLNGTARN